MALQNPNSLYSGGQGILRDNVVDYVTALENKKRAKDEALDKYYQNLPATINEKGVRDQDIPGLHQKINEVQQYWMENRDKIKKGNTPENFNYNRMWRDVKGGVTMSQNAAATALKLGQARLDPKKAYMFKGDDKTSALLSHEAPVWNPEHKGIDLPQFESVQPLDTKRHIEPLLNIKVNESEPRYEVIPGDKLNEMEVRERKYSPDDLSAVYLYSQEQLNNNGGFEKALETAVRNPETAAQLNDLFKRQYGRDAKNENDLAAAYTLFLKGDASPVYKRVPSAQARKQADFEIWKKKNAITFGQRKELAQQQHEYQKAMKYGYDNQWLDQNWENLKANPTGTLVVTKADGNKEEFKVLGVSNVYKKFFESQGYEPDDVIMDSQGNVSGVIYQRYPDKDPNAGKIIKSEATGNRPIVQSVIPVKMSEKQAKIYYGKSISSGKDLTGEIGTSDEQQVLSESTNEKTKSLAQRMKEAKMKK